MKKLAMGQVVLLIILFLAGSALGHDVKDAGNFKDEDWPWEKFSASFGGFITTTNTQLQLSSSTGLGGVVDLEDALGLDSNMFVFRADFTYRFRPRRRHRFDVSYASFTRGGEKVLQENIQIGDSIFPAGSVVDTRFDFDIIKTRWTYSLVQDKRVDFALGAGLYIMPIEFEVNGVLLNERQSITAPLPVFGARLDVALTKKLFLRQSADIFYLEINDFKGTIADIRFGLDYRIWKIFGVGAELEFFDIQLEGSGETSVPGLDLNGKVNFGFNGIMLYGKFYFGK